MQKSSGFSVEMASVEKFNGLRMDRDDLSENAVEALLGERPPSLVCLNFKVPLRVRQEFKVYAARRNMTMTELLLQLLDDRLTFDAKQSQLPTQNSQNKK